MSLITSFAVAILDSIDIRRCQAHGRSIGMHRTGKQLHVVMEFRTTVHCMQTTYSE